MALLEKADNQELTIIAPELLLLEAQSVMLQTLERTSEQQEKTALLFGLVDDGLIRVMPHTRRLYNKARDLCSRLYGGSHVSIYDSMFHALALLEGAVFVTMDKKHYRKTKDQPGGVTLLGDLEV